MGEVLQDALSAVLKRRTPGMHFNNLGYRDKDMPYYGAELHMDGNITIAAPQEVQQGTPEQILMEPGAACIATYNIPHSGSRNENGTESRKNIIFRIRNKRRQPDEVLTGLSDHPDRGWLGEWLEYEDGNDPWERSKQAMCNMWEEWEGMGEIVAAERSVETVTQ